MGSRSDGSGASGQVEGLGGSQVQTRQFSDTAGHELGGPDHYEDGIDVSLTGVLDIN